MKNWINSDVLGFDGHNATAENYGQGKWNFHLKSRLPDALFGRGISFIRNPKGSEQVLDYCTELLKKSTSPGIPW
jgi:hypothetical protein